MATKKIDISKTFSKNGGRFIFSAAEINKQFSKVKAVVFDWDGVFNNGVKDANGSSSFSEVDSMGTNLLRFAHYFKSKQMPYSAVISGEKNEAAFYWTKREHFNACYFKVANKNFALDHFCETHKIKPHEIAYFFDDVLDLSVAKQCGIRIFIPRKANPLLTNFVIKNKLADYCTGAQSGEFAVREGCELLMGVTGVADKIIDERMNYTDTYADYIAARNKITISFFTLDKNKIIASSL